MMLKDRVGIATFASTLPIEYNSTELRKAGILFDLPTPVWDMRTHELFLRVGDQFYWSDIKRKTFHEILIDHLSTVLGKEWKLAQASLPLTERHFIFECYNETDSYLSNEAGEVRKENEELNSVAPNGYVQSLITLAFDIYLLNNAGVLDEKLLWRLKLKDQYQGARYEITVASAFIKAGWTVE